MYVREWMGVCKRHDLTANERTFKFIGYVFRVRNGITGGLYRRLCHLRLVLGHGRFIGGQREIDLRREFRQFDFENSSTRLSDIIWKILDLDILYDLYCA